MKKSFIKRKKIKIISISDPMERTCRQTGVCCAQSIIYCFYSRVNPFSEGYDEIPGSQPFYFQHLFVIIN